MLEDDGIVVFMHYVYILRCSGGSLYVGETADLAARLLAHREGRSAHTATRRPVTLVYSEQLENRTLALGRERQLKNWTTAKKAALITGDLEKLRRL